MNAFLPCSNLTKQFLAEMPWKETFRLARTAITDGQLTSYQILYWDEEAIVKMCKAILIWILMWSIYEVTWTEIILRIKNIEEPQLCIPIIRWYFNLALLIIIHKKTYKFK